jgi:hypothetical protein
MSDRIPLPGFSAFRVVRFIELLFSGIHLLGIGHQCTFADGARDPPSTFVTILRQNRDRSSFSSADISCENGGVGNPGTVLKMAQ